MDKRLFVPKDLALILRDKGFDRECDHYYDELGEITKFLYYEPDRDNTTINNDFGGVKICTAPTIMEAMLWLASKANLDEQYITIQLDLLKTIMKV